MGSIDLKEYLLTEMLMGLFDTDTDSKGKNAKSAIKNGHLLSDSLADWVRLQLITRPYTGCPKKNARLGLEANNSSLEAAIGTCRTIFGFLMFSAFN